MVLVYNFSIINASIFEPELHNRKIYNSCFISSCESHGLPTIVSCLEIRIIYLGRS